MNVRKGTVLLRQLIIHWRNAGVFLLLLLLPSCCFAQDQQDNNEDEIMVLMEIRGIGNAEVPAIIRDKDVLLPINSLFDFLKIKNQMSQTGDSLSGFYVNQKDKYVVDQLHNRIIFKDTVYNVKPGDIIKSGSNLYVELKYLKKVFLIDGEFNFRRLLVSLSTEVELPAIRENKQELMRRNINRLNGEIQADTTVKRTYPLFHFGMADWAIMSTQQSTGSPETRLNLGLGAVAAGGEANASLNYSTLSQMNEKQQYYQWRYVNNDNIALRQVVAGKIFSQSISTLYAPVVGVQFTNAPTTYRKSYGTYTISNTIEPGWVVELYVNGILVDYKKADAAGFYSFDVPLIYGYSVIKLRFYGPYGEERTTQTYINIPFNFLPLHEFEYTASAGMVEDNKNSLYSRVGLNYGLSRSLTIGGGAEYLSSVTSGNTIPFINASAKLMKNLLLSGEYDYGVRSRSSLSYRHPSNLQIDLDYIKYTPGQKAIYFDYLEEQRATLSLPLHTTFMTMFSRFIINQITLPSTQYTNAEWTFTGTVRNVGLNFSNYASFVEQKSPYFYGLASVSLLLPAKISFTSQLQYDYKQGKPEFMKFSFEKHLLGKGFLNASYQQFFSSSSESYTGYYRNILVGLRYDFTFARLAASVLTDNQGGYSRVQTASGSLIYDHKSHYLNANNKTNVGRGGISIAPYLDINCNNKRDPGEPRVLGLKLHINGGRVVYGEKDSIIRILDLEPYVNYYIDLNRTSFDNIAWQIKNHLIKVTVNPNNLTLIEVPIAVVGEISGVVSREEKGVKGQKGEKQMIVNIYNAAHQLAGRTLTESDGFFSYTGLAPGIYTVQLDSDQLQKLQLRPKHDTVVVQIHENIDGDMADGVEFVLQSKSPVPVQTEQSKDTTITDQLAVNEKNQSKLPAEHKKKKSIQLIDDSNNESDANTHKKAKTNQSRNKDQAAASNSGNHIEQTSIGEEDTADRREIIAPKGTYTIQVCAMHSEKKAKQLQKALSKKLNLPVAVVHKGSYYKPRIIGFSKKKDVTKYLPDLNKKGIKNFLVVKLLYPIYKQ